MGALQTSKIAPSDFVLLQPYKLVRQPGNGVALAAARRMLDQISPADTRFLSVCQEHPYHFQLVVAGENLLALFLAGLFACLPKPRRGQVLFLHHLGIVFQDVGQSLLGKGFFP